MNDFLIHLFVKDSDNTSNVKVREQYGKFAGTAGIISNFFLFLIKITAGTIFNSVAITADAVNNLSDSGSSLITLIGFKISGKPADAKHPYGHARMEYVSGLMVALVILFLGFELVKTSISKIINPEPAEFSVVSAAVLILAILIKLWQCLFYRKIAKRIRSTTLLATSMDSRNDILATSAILLAAVITYFTHFNLDGYMGVVVAVIIIISGVKLVLDTISPLLGLAPTKELVECIYKKILDYDTIIGLHDLTVHTYGSGRYFASVHCEVPAEQDIMISHDIIDNIERDFLNDLGVHLVIHLDPVVTCDEQIIQLKQTVREAVSQILPEISIHDFRVVRGVTHSNMIFDVVVPYNFRISDKEIMEVINEAVNRIDETYYAVITVDHDFLGEE